MNQWTGSRIARRATGPFRDQRNHFEGPGHLEAPRHAVSDLDLRRNDDVDRHVVATEENDHGMEIAGCLDLGDFGGNF